MSGVATAEPSIDARLDAAARRCLAGGAALTEPRAAVLRVVLAAAAPLTAYDILDRLRGSRGRTTPPTVYRALGFLTEQGLVHRLERRGAYVACHDHADHAHGHRAQFLICRACGAVQELEDQLVDQALADAAARLGFSAEATTVEMEGLCAACAAS